LSLRASRTGVEGSSSTWSAVNVTAIAGKLVLRQTRTRWYVPGATAACRSSRSTSSKMAVFVLTLAGGVTHRRPAA